MLDRIPSADHANQLKQVHWLWTPILTLPFWTPWCGFLFIEKFTLGAGLTLISVTFLVIAGTVEHLLRGALNANFRRMDVFDRVHAEANNSPRPIALLLRSFGRVHGHLDVQTGFSIFWLLDEALRESGFQPVLLGTDVSLPDNHGTLLFPTENEKWQKAFEAFADAAAVIIVIPEVTGSLQTEMHLLRARGWLAKSVAVMTPASIRVQNMMLEVSVAMGGDDQARSDRWEITRERLSQQGLKLPPYNTEGALIEWSASGEIHEINLLSFEPGSHNENIPHSPERRRSFCRCWRAVQERRRYHGKSISETYLPIAPVISNPNLEDVLDPPGGDGSLRSAIVCLVGFGWVFPLALYVLNFLI